MRAGVGAGGEGGPVGGRPDGEGGIGLVDGSFVEEATKVRQASFGGKVLHHGGDETVHPIGINLFRHRWLTAPCSLREL